MAKPPAAVPAKDRAKVLRQVVADYRYKPGWTFAVLDGDFGTDESTFVQLDIVFPTPNSRRPSQGIRIVGHYLMPAHLSRPRAVADWIGDCIDDAEAHERSEWKRYKGRLLTDPHR